MARTLRGSRVPWSAARSVTTSPSTGSASEYGNEGRTYERCDVRYRDSWEERVDGYDVTYEYAGREYVTRMPYDPGERIRIRVDVTPTVG